MAWDLNSDRPIYIQLVEQIELKICGGIYPLGSKLPSVRDLAQEAAVNPNTMQRALVKLEEDGLLYANRTSGRFVTENTMTVNKLKNKLAHGHVAYFFKNMKELGLSDNEILEIVRNFKGEMS